MPLTPSELRWQRLQEVLEIALAASPGQQSEVLAQICHGDPQLLAAAQEALERFSDADDLLGLPALPQLAAVEETIPPGTRLGAYQIEREIGRGGMGIVYLAHRADDAFSKTVAIKVLRSPGTQRQELFRAERRILAHLEHPHIVRIHDGGQTSTGALYLVMEYTNGKPINQYCQDKQLPLRDTLTLVARIATAIGFAHRHGVLHADLKPSNILIDADGHPRVLDFGLSTLAGLSSPGFTPQYASPEQRAGQPVDARSDVYSLGAILSELTASFKLPADVQSILTRALQSDPAHRYSGALQLSSDLYAYLSHQPVAAHGNAVPYRAALFLRRNPWLLPAVATLGLVSAGYFYSRPEVLPIVSSVDRITFLDRRKAFPAFAPDSTHIAFGGLQTGNWDIYVQTKADQTPVNLTANSPADDTQPAWSPDGKSIAFHSERDGGGLFLMDASGANVRKLCPLGFHPAWSPDGRKIAYTSVELAGGRVARGLRRSQIWLYDLATGQNHQLIPDSALHDGIQPVWSPSGKQIVFWGTTTTGATQIYAYNLESPSAPIVIVKSGAFRSPEGRVWNPFYSPSGHHLYWFSDKGGAVTLLRASIDTSATLTSQPARIPLPVTDANYFASSPDGKHLIYTLDTDSFNIEKLPFDPVSLSVPGPPIQITVGQNAFVRPRVSPNGKQLVFESQTKGDLWLAQTDGSSPHALITGDKANFARFLTDSLIGYIGQSNEEYFAATISTDGQGKSIAIPPAPAIINSLRWFSPGSFLRSESNANRLKLQTAGRPTIEIRNPVPPNHALSFSTSAQDPVRILGRLIPLKRRQEAHAAIYDLQTRKLTDLGIVADDAIELFNNERFLLYKDFTHVLRLLDRQSGESRELFRFSPDEVIGVDLSRDHRWIYYGRSHANADVWVATLSAPL